MPVADASDQTMLEQRRFDGGVNMLAQEADQLADAVNIVIRDGRATTRGGVRRYLRAEGGYLAGFYFNADGERFNDAGHTGFWFPWEFVKSPWGVVQGCALIRLADWEEAKVVFASGGAVYVYEDGYVTEVAVSGVFADTETVEFVQGDDLVLMFRSGGVPKWWDGTATDGFDDMPAAGVGDDIPWADNGLYHQGRMWMTIDDEVYASLVLDFTEYDLTERYWSVQRGQGKPGVILYPFNEDTLLAFKDDRVMGFSGVNAIIEAGADLSSYVTQQVVNVKTGAIARHGIVTMGEDVWYLGYGGIWSLHRNQQAKIEMDPVAVSVPMQPYIDRINWAAASGACAAVHDNYMLFAVPVDGSTTNNLVLVYDRIARQGQGAWVGVWKGETLNPVRFFVNAGTLLFLSADGAVREMFTDDPWDSESAFLDTPAWDADEVCEPGTLRYYAGSGDQIWRALVTTKGDVPAVGGGIWELVDADGHVYDIESRIVTQALGAPAGQGPVVAGRMEVLVQNQNALVDVTLRGRDHGEETAVFEDLEWLRTEWDVAGLDDFEEDNGDLNANEAHRKDYSLIFDQTDGFWIDEDGVYAGVWETHGIRFVPMVVNDRWVRVEIVNSRGKLRVMGVTWLMTTMRMGGRAVA